MGFQTDRPRNRCEVGPGFGIPCYGILAFTCLVTLAGAAGSVNGLTATAVSPFEIALTWNETLADETGFVIERGVSGSGVWKPVINVAANVTAIRDLGVEPGVGYLYRITASLTGGGSSSSSVHSDSVTVPALASHAPLIILPIGDSITEGTGASGGYRDPLFTSLSNAGFPTKYVGSRNIGPTTALTNAGQANHEGHGSYATTLITGNLDGLLKPITLPYGTPPDSNNGGFWLTGISGRAAVYPDIILLLIGANDMGMFQRSAAQTLEYYDALLTKLVTLRPAALILCSTVLPYNGAAYPSGKDYSQREANNLAFSQMLPDLVSSYQADGRRVRLYDMRQKINPANAPALLSSDGVHPNQAGYQAIAAGWFEAIQQLPLIESWRTYHFGTATGRSADLADPDGDAAVNLLEYAFGTNPLAAGAALPLTCTTGADHATITFPRRQHADVRYVVEISTDLAPDSWSEDTVQAGSPVSLSPDFEQATFRDRQPRSAHSKRFMRVKIVKP